MDDELNGLIRRMVAELQAQRFILDYLLRHVLLTVPRKQRLKIAEGLLNASERTEHISGIAQGDEMKAANLGEITERMQTSIDQYIGRALSAIDKVEAESAAQRPKGSGGH